MTSAALEALILRDCLKEHGGQVDAALPREFFARIAAFQKDPWGLATGADFSFSATEGRRPPLAARALNRVIGKMLEVGNDDPKIGDRLAEVVHMVRLPSALLDREILVRIAKAWGRRIIGRRPKAESNGAMPPLGAAPALGA
jgi:hypothetical protein